MQSLTGGRFTTFVVALTLSSAATAAKFETKELDDINFIVLSGDIAVDDDKKFNRIATVFDEAVVVLDSNGGSTIAAIKMGESIRLKGYSTYVSDTNACASACALIWLAGSPRILDERARVGFHATYTDIDGRKLESGRGNALVGRYLTLLNLNERTVLFATSAPPASLNWLTSKNFQNLGVDVQIIAEKSEPDPVPPPVVRTVSTVPQKNSEVSLWKNVGTWTIRVDHTLNDGCFGLSDYDKYAFRVGFNQTDSLETYVILVGSEWKSLEENKKYELSLTFDEETPWNGSATGVKMGEIIGLKMDVSDDKFWDEFSSSKNLRVDYNGSFLVKLKMGESKNAFNEIIECQKQQLNSSQRNDPFAK
jgi:hypothetical protein